MTDKQEARLSVRIDLVIEDADDNALADLHKTTLKFVEAYIPRQGRIIGHQMIVEDFDQVT